MYRPAVAVEDASGRSGPSKSTQLYASTTYWNFHTPVKAPRQLVCAALVSGFTAKNTAIAVIAVCNQEKGNTRARQPVAPRPGNKNSHARRDASSTGARLPRHMRDFCG